MTNYKIFVQHYFRYLTFSPVNFVFFCYRITFPSLTNAHERAPGTRRRIFKVAHDGAPHIPQPRRTRADMFVGNERANSRMCLSLSRCPALPAPSNPLPQFCYVSAVCARVHGAPLPRTREPEEIARDGAPLIIYHSVGVEVCSRDTKQAFFVMLLILFLKILNPNAPRIQSNLRIVQSSIFGASES